MIFLKNSLKEQEMMIFRQGDILITRVNNINDKKYSLIPNSKTVAQGELTGHHHTFSEQSQVLLYKDEQQGQGQQQEDPSLIVVKSPMAELVHQEHNPILLPEGTYKVTRETEYNPFLNLIQRTAD